MTQSIVMQEFVAVIQARMGSSRLPGKTFCPFNGKPALEHLIDSLVQYIDKSQIVIATSKSPADDIISEYGAENDIRVFRGDLENVASRFCEIARSSRSDYIVRINADSPLFDYRVLRLALETFQSNDCDLVTTSFARSVPSGLHVEIFRAEVFMEAYKKFSTAHHLEHVTAYFYEHRDDFKILPLPSQVANPEQYKFSLDTAEDQVKLEKLFALLEKPHYAYALRDKCELYKRYVAE